MYVSCRNCCNSEQTDAWSHLQIEQLRETTRSRSMEADLHQQPSEGMQEALWCSSGLFMQPTLGSNTATTQLNTSQHAVQCCSTLLNNTVQHPLSPPHNNGPAAAASSSPSSAPLQFKLQEAHIVGKHGRIPAFQRSTFQTSPLPNTLCLEP